MTTQQFHLLGDDSSSSRPIELDTTLDIDGLKNLIAAHFAIFEPSGMCHVYSIPDINYSHANRGWLPEPRSNLDRCHRGDYRAGAGCYYH